MIRINQVILLQLSNNLGETLLPFKERAGVGMGMI
jgi:hypothetical protein